MSQRDPEDKALVESFEKGEWRTTHPSTADLKRYQAYARATIAKDKRINIRLSSKDLQALQKRALEEGIPYQTLIASILHKYAAGRLTE